jgi:ATP-dependent RNA helicase RhlE
MSFQNLGLSEALVHGVQRMGYVDPTLIQPTWIPLTFGTILLASRRQHRKDGGVWSAPALLVDSQASFALSNSRAYARAGDAGGYGLRDFTDSCQVALIHGESVTAGKRRRLAEASMPVATPGRLSDHMCEGGQPVGARVSFSMRSIACWTWLLPM